MLPKTRKAINLEGHWGNDNQPFVQWSANEEIYDANFERLLELHPIPENYDPLGDEENVKAPPLQKF